MDTWLSLPQRFQYVSLDEFIIMPNHVHGIVFINDVRAGSPRPSASDLHEIDASKPPTLGQIIAYFKYQAAKHINIYRVMPSISVWQRGYYDHVIRNEAELTRVREYIQNNPSGWEFDQENPINRQVMK